MVQETPMTATELAAAAERAERDEARAPGTKATHGNSCNGGGMGDGGGSASDSGNSHVPSRRSVWGDGSQLQAANREVNRKLSYRGKQKVEAWRAISAVGGDNASSRGGGGGIRSAWSPGAGEGTEDDPLVLE
ncbi:uncharacterized protein HMPREF1541_06972 [Cyphellophora europaea CBS 101466]|uniref:Uncharacterized protein n=1 Tax=Cyphellophora europaea (strain CBS 101466) TaxID=1220924 RepID=W2RRK3_CYPE1|nr:uncharacterized protein HMPREF1541_06972 [Cyphellophora europaea CBS 101466]ETN38930.1 hypothetical protein HMPREF1541_06972 [Cyphellophora europaea CBS 101466]